MELRTDENLNLFFIGLSLIGFGLALNRFIDLFYFIILFNACLLY